MLAVEASTSLARSRRNCADYSVIFCYFVLIFGIALPCDAINTTSVSASPEPTLSVTVTESLSNELSMSPSRSKTLTSSMSQTYTASESLSSTRSVTSSETDSLSASPSQSASQTLTASLIPSESNSITISASFSNEVSSSPTSSITVTKSVSLSDEISRSETCSVSLTNEFSLSPSETTSGTLTDVQTLTEAFTETLSPSFRSPSPTITFSLGPLTATPTATGTHTMSLGTQSKSKTSSLTKSKPTLSKSYSATNSRRTPTISRSRLTASVVLSGTVSPSRNTITPTILLPHTPTHTITFSNTRSQNSPTHSMTQSEPHSPTTTLTLSNTLTRTKPKTPSLGTFSFTLSNSNSPTETSTLTLSATPGTPTESTSKRLTLTDSLSNTKSFSRSITLPTSTLSRTPVPTPTPSISVPTPSPTVTDSLSRKTVSPSNEKSLTPSTSPSLSNMPTLSSTSSVSKPTATQSRTVSPSRTVSRSQTASTSISRSPTHSVSMSISRSITSSGSPSPSLTQSHVSTLTISLSFSSSDIASSSQSWSPSSSESYTADQSSTRTLSFASFSISLGSMSATFSGAVTVTDPTFTLSLGSFSPSFSFSPSVTPTFTAEISLSESVSGNTFSSSDELTMTVSGSVSTSFETHSVPSGSFTNPTISTTLEMSKTNTLSFPTHPISTTYSPDTSMSFSASVTPSLSVGTMTGSRSSSAEESMTMSLSETISDHSPTLSLTLASTYTGSMSWTTTLSKTVTFSPTISITPIETQTLSQSKGTLTQTVTKTASWGTGSLSDESSMTPSSSASPSNEWTRTVTRTLTDPSISLSEAYTMSLDTHTLSDTTTITASTSQSVTASLTGEFSMSSSPTSSNSPSKTFSLSLSATTTNSIATFTLSTLSLSLPVTVTDTVSMSGTKTNTLTSSPTASMSVSETFSVGLSTTPAITDTQLLSKSESLPITVSSSKSLSASYSQSLTGGTRTPTMSPRISISESISGSTSTSLTDTRSVSTTKSVSSSTTKSESTTTSVTDSPSTSVSRSVSSSSSLSPSKTLTDPLSPSVTLQLTESVSSTFGTHSMSKTKSLSETQLLTESITLPLSATTTLSSTFPITPSDSVTTTMTRSFSGSESISHTYTMTHSPSVTRETVTESFSGYLTDSIRTFSYTGSYSGTSDVTLTHSDTRSLTRIPTSSFTPSETVTPPVTPSPSLTKLPTPTHTIGSFTHTSIPTVTFTPTISFPLSSTKSLNPTVTVSEPISGSGTLTLLGSPTTTFALSQTASLPVTPSSSLMPTPTFSFTPSNSIPATNTPSSSLAVSESDTLLPTPSWTPSPSASETFTFSASSSSRITPTVSVDLTLTLSLSFSLAVPPTGSATFSSITHTFSHGLTVSVSVPASPTVSLEPTFTPMATLSMTITPPATQTRTLEVTLSDSVPLTGTLSPSSTLSPFSTTQSYTNEKSLSPTQSQSHTVTDSLSKTFSGTISLTVSLNVFTGESNFVTNPYSSVDVLPLGRASLFAFVYSPPYADGDRAGIVPVGSPCTSDGINPVRAMQMMYFRGPKKIPSNWTITVWEHGAYQVCTYQAIVPRWTFVNPGRYVFFGSTPRRGPSAVVPHEQEAGDKVSVAVFVVGGTDGDEVRMIPFGKSCQMPAQSVYLSVKEVSNTEHYIVTIGTVQKAGRYTVCYKGYPQHLSSTFNIYGPVIVRGVVTTYQFHTPLPSLAMKNLNMTLTGIGLTWHDEFYLASARTCSPSSIVSHGRIHSNSSDGSSFNVLFTLHKSGSLTLCYRSNISTHRQAVKSGIIVEDIFADEVVPSNRTYAAGTRIELHFLGELLSPGSDSAELHFGTDDCTSNVVLKMEFDGSAWSAIATTPGAYRVCYNPTATYLHGVGSAFVFVSPRFYAEQSSFYEGISVGDKFSIEVEGHGLNLVNDTIWMQPSSMAQCENVTSPGAVAPILIESHSSATWNISARGVYVVCYRTYYGAVLKSIDKLPVLPVFPTSFSPLSGHVTKPHVLHLHGSVEFDLNGTDRVGLCTQNSISTPLNAVSAASVQFVPLSVGYYQLCAESGIRIHDGQSSVVRAIGSIPFAAFAVIESIVFSPVAPVVGTTGSIAINGTGLTPSDTIAACDPSNISASVPAALESPHQSSLGSWTAKFVRVGRLTLCYNSAGSPPMPMMSVAEVVVEPLLVSVQPTLLYADEPTNVSYIGKGIEMITSFHVVPAGNNCSDLSGWNFDARKAEKYVTIEIPLRGTYLLCYTGISGRMIQSSAEITVLPRVISMEPLSEDVYGGCVSEIRVKGSGLDSSRDMFYISHDSRCASITAKMALKNISPDPVFTSAVFTVIPPQNEITYQLCCAPDGDMSVAFTRGSITASAPFTLVPQDESGYKIEYRCALPAPGVKFKFELSISDVSPWIALDSPLSDPTVTIGQLPIRYFKVRVQLIDNNGTVLRESLMTSSVQPGADYCQNFPQSTSPGASLKKKYAESLFALMNFLALSCGNTPGAGNPTAILRTARDAIANDSTLLNDPKTVLPLLSGVLSSTPAPTLESIALMDVTLPVLSPYVPVPGTTLEAHVTFAADILTVTANDGKSESKQKQTAVLSALHRSNAIASVMCASPDISLMGDGILTVAATKANPGTNGAIVQVGQTLEAEILMKMVSKEGSCFSIIVLSQNVLPQNGLEIGLVRRRETVTESPNELKRFNLPLFSVTADPFFPPEKVSTLWSTSLRYSYPPALHPAVPSVIDGEIFAFTGSEWSQLTNVKIFADTSARVITINISSVSSNSIIVSGVVRWIPIDTSEPTQSIDLTLLITALVCIVISLAGFGLGRHRDAMLDDREPNSENLLKDRGRSVIAHRYIACFARIPHHPVTSPERLAVVIVYVFGALLTAIVYAWKSPTGSNAVLGLASGVICALLASPAAALVRVTFSIQFHEWPTIFGGGTAFAIVVIVPFFASLELAALSSTVVGLIVFAIVALIRKGSFSFEHCPRPGPLPQVAGWCCTILFAVCSTAMAVYKTIDPLPDGKKALWIFLWAIFVDIALFEWIKHVAMLAIWGYCNKASAAEASPQKALPFETPVTRLRALLYEDSDDSQLPARYDAARKDAGFEDDIDLPRDIISQVTEQSSVENFDTLTGDTVFVEIDPIVLSPGVANEADVDHNEFETIDGSVLHTSQALSEVDVTTGTWESLPPEENFSMPDEEAAEPYATNRKAVDNYA